jgi:hypothetical protein
METGADDWVDPEATALPDATDEALATEVETWGAEAADELNATETMERVGVGATEVS